jgi:HAE1 family hydrophobic/amphiphilic exporter-1
MSLSALSVSRPITVLMFYIGVVLLGVVAFLNLSVDFLPPIKIPKLTVQTSYANTSPEEVEQAVTQPIEAALGTVVGAKRVSSITREGQSVVTVEFYWGTNMDFALLEVREKLDQMRGALPREAGRPTILRVDPSTEPIMTLALSFQHKEQKWSGALVEVKQEGENGRGGDQAGLVELKETARALIKKRIEQIDGVAQVSVLGGVEREIQVIVDQHKLEALGLSLDQVAQALTNANMSLPGGSIKKGLFRYPLRALGEFSDLDDIRKVVVLTTPAGRLVRVADIGSVRDTIKERAGLTRYNGNEVIALHVRKEAGTNTIEVSRSIHRVLDQLRQEYPSLQLHVLADQAEFIAQSVADVQQAIAIGAVLAFLVLFLFLRRMRYPFIIGVTIPVSLLATCIVMYFLNINLNVISLTGLALGIGMLGDNAIIVIENVTRLREKGMPLLDAVVEGAKEINLAVTASTLTNVAIFLPIVFVEGVAAKLFVDMGVTMTVSLLVSLFVAVTLVPMLLTRERPAHAAAPRSVIGESLERLVLAFNVRAHDWLDRYLAWSLTHRAQVMVGTLAALVCSVLIAFTIRSEPAPDIDQSRFTIQLVFPKGTLLEAVSSQSAELERRLMTLHDVQGVYAAIGVTEEQIFSAFSDAAPERATLEVKVKPGAATAAVMEEARKVVGTFLERSAGVEYALRSRGTTFEQILRPEANDLRVRVMGKDPSTVAAIAGKFGERMKAVGGVTDIRTSLQAGAAEYRLEVDRDAATRSGVSVHDVARAIRAHVQGAEPTTFSEFDRKITIRVKPGSVRSLEDLLEMRVGGTSLRAMVRGYEMTGAGEIWRENHQRAQVILANVTGRSLDAVVKDLERVAAAFALSPGYAISIGGENEEIRESFRSLLIIIVLSIFLVYMILAAEYESVLYPFVILLTSPLAFIGAIGAMALTGQAYNVMSLIGLVIMIGAVDNDAVIVVDVITALRRSGVPLHDAIRQGMKQRLRPILMTTATTVLGIVPLFFEFGTGSELVRALTVPIVGGLVASTFFTVVAIPIVYTLIDKRAA